MLHAEGSTTAPWHEVNEVLLEFVGHVADAFKDANVPERSAAAALRVDRPRDPAHRRAGAHQGPVAQRRMAGRPRHLERRRPSGDHAGGARLPRSALDPGRPEARRTAHRVGIRSRNPLRRAAEPVDGAIRAGADDRRRSSGRVSGRHRPSYGPHGDTGIPPLSWTPRLARVCAWRDPWQDGSEGSSRTHSRRTR